MRCHICDKSLTEEEIQTAPDGSYEPCSVCMNIILETAYSDGFTRPGDEFEEIEDEGSEVETLDEETYRSVYDHCDFSLPDNGINDYE